MKYNKLQNNITNEIKRSKLYFLSITNLIEDMWNYGGFFGICSNIRWIYSVSHDLELLCRFRNKLLEYTDLEKQTFIKIEILPLFILSDKDIIFNFSNCEKNYKCENTQEFFYKYLDNIIDHFWVEGIINFNSNQNIHNNRFKLSEFKKEHWNI